MKKPSSGKSLIVFRRDLHLEGLAVFAHIELHQHGATAHRAVLGITGRTSRQVHFQDNLLPTTRAGHSNVFEHGQTLIQKQRQKPIEMTLAKDSGTHLAIGILQQSLPNGLFKC